MHGMHGQWGIRVAIVARKRQRVDGRCLPADVDNHAGLDIDGDEAKNDIGELSVPSSSSSLSLSSSSSSSASQPVNPSVPLQGQVRSLPDDVERDPR